MNKPLIITISREYGSGGHAIGQKLAEQLGIPFYDREIITMAAQESGEDEVAFEQLDKGMSEYAYAFSLLDANNQNDRLFVIQAQMIRKLAERGSCVIVGRCADYVLRDCASTYNIFIGSSSIKKMERVHKKGLFRRESMSPDAKLKEIIEMDKRRSVYYNHYTGRTWGDARNYDLCIDSSRVGAGACAVILAYIEQSERML